MNSSVEAELDKLEKCFISISETNTEDEIMKNRSVHADQSELESDASNRLATSMISEPSNVNSTRIQKNYNPNLIFKAGNSLSKETNTKVKTSFKKNKSENNIPRSISKGPSKLRENSNSNNQNKLISHFKTENSELRTQMQNEINVLNKKFTDIQKTHFQLRQEKVVLEDENAVLKLEKEKILSIKDNQISMLNEKLMKLEIENGKLKEMNEFAKKRIDEHLPKVHSYDEINEKYKRLCNENEKLLENYSSLNNILQMTKKEKEDLNAKFELIRIENEALKNDKFYLSKESLALNEKLLTSNDKIKVLEEDIREMRKTNQKYIDKLTEKNLNIDNSYEEKLRRELEDMKKKYEDDKENLKKLFEELADKRCTYLTEEKEDLKSKNIKLERTVKDKEEAIDFLNTEMRSFSKRTDEELSFLRVQLKIKTEELDRVMNLYEENLNMIKILKNENESLKDKNDVIRSELIKKEADFRSEISECKAQLTMHKERIANYEQIENELDKVIVDSAVLADDDKSNDVINIIKDIPTSSKRRISQCLVLANKLKIMTIELEKLKDLNSKLENELRLTSEERDLFRNVADKSKQPYSYLIKNMQDLELELYRKNMNLEEKDNSVKSLLRENELLNEKIKAIESDMKAVLNNRKKLDSLEEIIAKFIENDTAKANPSIKSIQNYYEQTENMSTNYNTKNFLSQNIFSPISRKNENSSMIEIPERDMNKSLGSSNTQTTSMPRWYQNLKLKEKFK